MAKSKYEEYIKDNLIVVEGYARDGLTDEQIAHNLGISPSTFYEYKKIHSEFSEALKVNKEISDRHVENALYKNALGYSYDEITKERVLNQESGEYELQVTKVVKKEVQGNTSAQIFWLKNRKPKDWRDKQEIQHSGETNVNVNADMTPEERQKRIDELKKKLEE